MEPVDLATVMAGVDPTRHFPLILAIAVGFAATYFVCYFACGVWNFPDRVLAAGNLVALGHAVLVSVPSVWLVFFTDSYSKNALFDTTWLGELTCCTICGYLTYDFTYVIYKRADTMWQFMLHHSVSFAVIWYCNAFCAGQLYALIGIVFEVSTPFIHICWLLESKGLGSSLAYKLTGACFYLSFLFGRVVNSVYLAYRVFAEFETVTAQGSMLLNLCMLAPVFFVVLNWYWFYLATLQLLLLLKPSPPSPQPTASAKKSQ